MRLPRTSAGRGVVVCFLALLLASLLNAEGLRKTAEIQPQGIGRDVALAVTRPLVAASRAIHLSTPRHELQLAIGRGSQDRIDTTVHLPPARPAPKLGRKPPRAHVPAAPAPPVPKHPLRLWVGGDSLAQIPGEALERLSGRRTMIDVDGVESRLSTGLARPDLYNWFTRFGQVIADVRPDVAVLSFGADDAHDYMAGVPEGRTIGPFGSPSWIREYRRRVEGVTRELNAAGIVAVWLGLPIPDGPGFRRSFPVINRILRSVAHEHRRAAAYVDAWHTFSGAHGRYTPYLRVGGRLTLVRLPDGVHYTAAGGDLLAHDVLRALGRFYRLPRG